MLYVISYLFIKKVNNHTRFTTIRYITMYVYNMLPRDAQVSYNKSGSRLTKVVDLTRAWNILNLTYISAISL